MATYPQCSDHINRFGGTVPHSRETGIHVYFYTKASFRESVSWKIIFNCTFLNLLGQGSSVKYGSILLGSFAGDNGNA
jgi:hypothetical protein